MAYDMDLDTRVLDQELCQIGHSLLRLREDIGLVGSEEEVLDLHLDTLADMLHIEVDGILYEVDGIVLGHIALGREASDIVSLGERRLYEAVVTGLCGIEGGGILHSGETYHSLDRLAGLYVVDIHAERRDNRCRDAA